VFYPKQIAALKYLIEKNRSVTPLGKQIVWFLFDQSQRLKKQVHLTITESDEWPRQLIHETALSVDTLNSSNSTTHFGAVMAALSTKFKLSIHFGHFDGKKFDTSGQFFGGQTVMRYTFWFAKEYYSRHSEAVSVSRAELEAIDLSKPGLYPSLENQRKIA
jgi:hypothetical protein